MLAIWGAGNELTQLNFVPELPSDGTDGSQDQTEDGIEDFDDLYPLWWADLTALKYIKERYD